MTLSAPIKPVLQCLAAVLAFLAVGLAQYAGPPGAPVEAAVQTGAPAPSTGALVADR